MQRYDAGSDDPSDAPSSGNEEEQVRAFWRSMQGEVEQVGNDPAEFKNHQLPLARIKKIMKSDEDVRMISAEAPVLFAKACELFILELTLKARPGGTCWLLLHLLLWLSLSVKWAGAWLHAERSKRRTLQRSDISAVVNSTYVLDFLQDIIPKEGDEPQGGGADGAGGSGHAGGVASGGGATPVSPDAAAAQAHAQAAAAAAAAAQPSMYYAPYPSGMAVPVPMQQQQVDPMAFMAAQQMQQQWAAQAAAMQAAAAMGAGAGTPQLPTGDTGSQL